MQAAKFKTLCEAMGWSIEYVAERYQVAPRTVRRWFAGASDIPDAIAGDVAGEWDAWCDVLGQVLDGMEDLAAENGDPEGIHVSRPRGSTGDDMRQAAKIAAIATVLGAQGFDVEIDYTEE
jgi:hypothetical protein